MPAIPCRRGPLRPTAAAMPIAFFVRLRLSRRRRFLCCSLASAPQTLRLTPLSGRQLQPYQPRRKRWAQHRWSSIPRRRWQGPSRVSDRQSPPPMARGCSSGTDGAFRPPCAQASGRLGKWRCGAAPRPLRIHHLADGRVGSTKALAGVFSTFLFALQGGQHRAGIEVSELQRQARLGDHSTLAGAWSWSVQRPSPRRGSPGRQALPRATVRRAETFHSRRGFHPVAQGFVCGRSLRKYARRTAFPVHRPALGDAARDSVQQVSRQERPNRLAAGRDRGRLQGAANSSGFAFTPYLITSAIPARNSRAGRAGQGARSISNPGGARLEAPISSCHRGGYPGLPPMRRPPSPANVGGAPEPRAIPRATHVTGCLVTARANEESSRSTLKDYRPSRAGV